MIKKLILCCLLLAMMLPINMVGAQDPILGTKEDNACNEGGSMAGKCDTPWAWECGYYLARWEANGGWNTPNNPFNDACVSLLPPVPATETVTAQISTFCFYPNTPEWKVCVTGNYITYDVSMRDGVIDFDDLVLPPGSCPVGRAYAHLFGTFDPQYYNVLAGMFPDSYWLCRDYSPI